MKHCGQNTRYQCLLPRTFADQSKTFAKPHKTFCKTKTIHKPPAPPPSGLCIIVFFASGASVLCASGTFFLFFFASLFSHQQVVSCPLAPSVVSPASLERYQPWQSMPLALCLVVAVTATPAAFASCHVLPWLPACKARKLKRKPKKYYF